MSNWQPIETAPKDKNVMLWLPDFLGGTVREGFWRNGYQHWGFYGSFTLKSERNHQPTHWQPRPEPPSA